MIKFELQDLYSDCFHKMKLNAKLEQQSMVHHRLYPLFMFDLDLGVPQKNTQYPLHHMTYAPGKFEVAMSNDLGGDKFLRKYIL